LEDARILPILFFRRIEDEDAFPRHPNALEEGIPLALEHLHGLRRCAGHIEAVAFGQDDARGLVRDNIEQGSQERIENHVHAQVLCERKGREPQRFGFGAGRLDSWKRVRDRWRHGADGLMDTHAVPGSHAGPNQGTTAPTTAESAADDNTTGVRVRSALTIPVAAPAVRASTIQIQVLVTTEICMRIGDLSQSVEGARTVRIGGCSGHWPLRRDVSRQTGQLVPGGPQRVIGRGACA